MLLSVLHLKCDDLLTGKDFEGSGCDLLQVMSEFPGGTEKSHEKHQRGSSVSWSRFKPSSY
jgi:hypothetical protein